MNLGPRWVTVGETADFKTAPPRLPTPKALAKAPSLHELFKEDLHPSGQCAVPLLAARPVHVLGGDWRNPSNPRNELST